MVNGNTKYLKATVDIYFDDDHVSCRLCPLLQTYSRNQCMKNGMLIPDINGIGKWCPLHDVEIIEYDGEKNETD